MALHNRKCRQGEALENVTINTQPLQKTCQFVLFIYLQDITAEIFTSLRPNLNDDNSLTFMRSKM